MSSIGILGAGTWGTALVRVLVDNGHDVCVWSAVDSEIQELASKRAHPNLPGLKIADSVIYTKSLEEACRGRDIILFAVASVYIRDVASKVAEFLPRDGSTSQIIVSVAKGIEENTLYTMTQIISDEICRRYPEARPVMVALTGPTHAEEVAVGQPSAIVASSEDIEAAKFVQGCFAGKNFRVYTNSDIDGVQLCGAVKNIIALASGISVGLGFGDNAKAALITRGMAEISRLGKAMGCHEQTFSGLAGMGDLIVTATSDHSRNNRCGFLLGQGVKTKDAIEQIGMVVEGINAIPAILALAKRYNVEMPICEAVDRIINGGEDPRQAVSELLSRQAAGESEKTGLDIEYDNAVLFSREKAGMRRVVTYGTFDLLHYGHINLLRRAKALGDYLIVALSTDEFNRKNKGKKCYFTYEQRKALLEALRYVDLVIPEESWDQKRSDALEYSIDTFVIGDDWKGKFDFLKEDGVQVVYLPRTPEVSTTRIKRDLNKKGLDTEN